MLYRKLQMCFPSNMRKRTLVFITVVGVSVILNGIGFGQFTPNVIMTTEQVSLYSKILNEDRPLYISVPTGDNDEKYPVLYLLDGKSNTKLISGIVDYLSTCKIIPKMIVVGIGNTDRTRDMTPSKSVMFANSGGAENLHKFITSELIPYMDKAYPSSSEKLLVGHSLGGLFSFYSLINAPAIFNAYIAVSPSIQYNDFEYPPVIENFFKNRKKRQGFLFMSFSNEGNGGAFRRLNELYRNILPNTGNDFKIECRHYPDNNHITTLIPAVSDALIGYFKNK